MTDFTSNGTRNEDDDGWYSVGWYSNIGGGNGNGNS